MGTLSHPKAAPNSSASSSAATSERVTPREPTSERHRADSLHSLLAFAAEVKSLQQQQQRCEGAELSTTTPTADSSESEACTNYHQIRGLRSVPIPTCGR